MPQSFSIENIQKDIDKWISRITKKQKRLEGLAVCPFAVKSGYDLIITDGTEINLRPNAEITVCVLPQHYSQEDLIKLANEYNNKMPEMVFLPDHKDRRTEINGVQTNNGSHNLILCQKRTDLCEARNKLKNTNYYEFWNKEYLKEILKT
jgi:hypothetical protein